MDGLIDHLGRPILRVEMPEPGAEGFLCQIDTGFNRYLLFERSVAHAIGFRQQNSTVIDQIVLGDGSIKSAWLARGTIVWFGAPMVVDAHIVPDAKRSRYSSPEYRVDALIGTALLDGLHVFLDFHTHRLTLRRPDLIP